MGLRDRIKKNQERKAATIKLRKGQPREYWEDDFRIDTREGANNLANDLAENAINRSGIPSTSFVRQSTSGEKAKERMKQISRMPDGSYREVDLKDIDPSKYNQNTNQEQPVVQREPAQRIDGGNAQVQTPGANTLQQQNIAAPTIQQPVQPASVEGNPSQYADGVRARQNGSIGQYAQSQLGQPAQQQTQVHEQQAQQQAPVSQQPETSQQAGQDYTDTVRARQNGSLGQNVQGQVNATQQGAQQAQPSSIGRTDAPNFSYQPASPDLVQQQQPVANSQQAPSNIGRTEGPNFSYQPTTPEQVQQANQQTQQNRYDQQSNASTIGRTDAPNFSYQPTTPDQVQPQGQQSQSGDYNPVGSERYASPIAQAGRNFSTSPQQYDVNPQPQSEPVDKDVVPVIENTGREEGRSAANQPIPTPRIVEESNPYNKSTEDLQGNIQEPKIVTDSDGNQVVEGGAGTEENPQVDAPAKPQQKYDEAEMKRLVAAGANPEEMYEFLARNPYMWKELKRLEQEAQDELDPKKKAEREKKEKIERNLIGLFNMVGALGNFASAVGSRDGRSVPVANAVEAEDKKIAADKADRLQRLNKYEEAQKKYGDYISSLYNKIAARKATDKALQAKKDIAGMNPKNNPEYLQSKMNEQKYKEQIARHNAAKAEYAEQLAKGQITLQEYKIKMLPLEYEDKLLDLKNKKDKQFYHIQASGTSPAIDIPINNVNETTVAGAWAIISKDKQLSESILKMIHPDKPVGDSSFDANSMFGFDSKTYSQNEAQMKAAIGIALEQAEDFPGSEATIDRLKTYLINLSGKAPSADPDMSDPYGTSGSESSSGDTGSDSGFDPSDPTGKKKREAERAAAKKKAEDAARAAASNKK